VRGTDCALRFGHFRRLEAPGWSEAKTPERVELKWTFALTGKSLWSRQSTSEMSRPRNQMLVPVPETTNWNLSSGLSQQVRSCSRQATNPELSRPEREMRSVRFSSCVLDNHIHCVVAVEGSCCVVVFLLAGTIDVDAGFCSAAIGATPKGIWPGVTR